MLAAIVGAMTIAHRLWNAPYALLTVTALAWAGNSVVGRAAGHDVPPVALAFWRWSLAAVIAALIAPRLRDDWAAIRANLWPLARLALLGIAVFVVLLYWGLTYTTAINSLLMQSAQPVLVLVAAFLLYGERAGPLRLLGIALSAAGILVIVARGNLAALLALDLNPGDALILVATLLYAIYSVLLRDAPKLHPLSFAAATFALGAAAILPAYAVELWRGARIVTGPGAAMAIAYVVLAPSLVGYLFYNRGVALIGAARAGAFMNVMPAFGAAMSIAFLGETLHGFHFAGVGLIAAGILLSARP